MPWRLWWWSIWSTAERSPNGSVAAVGWIINIKENKIFIIIIGVDGRECSSPPASSAAHPISKCCESVAVTAPLSTSHSVTPSSASELVLRRSFVRFRPFTVSKLWILFIWWMEAVPELDYLVFVDTRIGDVAMWWARTDAQKVTPSVFVCFYIRSRFKVSSGWLVANTHSRIDSKVA